MKRRYTDLVLYQRLLLEARPFWVHLTALFLLGLLQAPLMLLMPVPLKIAVDNILGEQHLPEMIQSFLPAFIRDSSAGLLMAAVFLVIGLNLLLYLRGLADWLLQTYTGEKLILNFRSKLFRHLQRLSFSYHDSKGTADSVYRIQYDTYAVQQFAIGGLIPLI
ncbi:MAG TPA: ABC transporter transmembrane domain-containing protein, partial [bacterium]|nr:ABC transporter transmembrane domain-containing protein [bacterium]